MKTFWIYYNSKNIGKDLNIDELGWHFSEPKYEFSETRVNNIIYCVNRGNCKVTVWQDKKEIDFLVNEGEAFYIHQGLKYRYISDENDGCDRYWLSFSGEKVQELLTELNINSDYSVIKDFNILEIEKSIKKIRAYIIKDDEYMFGMYSEAFRIFYELAKKGNINEHKDIKDSKDVLIDAISNYIDQNINNISVGDISKKIGYEQSYLYRIFYKKCGMSLQQYILKKKMNHARYLLSSTEMSMEEVAERLGYDSYVSFSKSFKKYANSSPAQFKRNNMTKKHN